MHTLCGLRDSEDSFYGAEVNVLRLSRVIKQMRISAGRHRAHRELLTQQRGNSAVCIRKTLALMLWDIFIV